MRPSDIRAIGRRAFLQASAAGLAGAAIGAGPEAPAGLDAHTHFYDPGRPQGVPWPGKGDKVLYRTMLPREFKELTERHGIRSTIAVEASPWLEDNQWLLDLAAREPFLAGVVGRLDPADGDFAKHLDRFARDPLFVGIRIGHESLRRGLEQKAFLDNLRLLIRHDRELDVNGGPDMPADAARLARLLPELRVVINHAANPTIDGKAPPADWQRGLRAAAEGKRVFCKVSALVEGTRRPRDEVPAGPDFYTPVLDALWDVFGEDRLIYASNWPVSETAAPYATVHAVVSSYFRKKGDKVSEKFFLRNALAAYKPPERRR